MDDLSKIPRTGAPNIGVAAPSTQPVLIFQLNLWKIKRWGESTPPSDGVVKVFEHNSSDHGMGAAIAKVLEENGLTNADVINIAPMEPPAHARVDIGTLELWLFCRNPNALKA